MQQTGCSAEGMEPFALRVMGESMAPEFQDGHIIVVDPGYPFFHGVYAVVKSGEEYHFGQYIKDETGHWIHYLNPDFPPIALAHNFEVKGVVTQRNGRRRKDMKRYDYTPDKKVIPLTESPANSNHH